MPAMLSVRGDDRFLEGLDPLGDGLLAFELALELVEGLLLARLEVGALVILGKAVGCRRESQSQRLIAPRGQTSAREGKGLTSTEGLGAVAAVSNDAKGGLGAAVGGGDEAVATLLLLTATKPVTGRQEGRDAQSAFEGSPRSSDDPQLTSEQD